MSEHLHANFLIKCQPCKQRRTWGRTVVDLIMLLALSALAGWLLALVKGSLISHSVTCYRVPGLAMMPVPVLAMDGHQAAALACLAVGLPGIAWAVFWGVRKMRKVDEEAALSWEVIEGAECPICHRALEACECGALVQLCDVRAGVPASPPEDPLALPAPGLNVDELRRILGSLLQQIQEARDLVKSAQGHLSVEDYGNNLATAHLLMGLATTCLAELLAKTDPSLKSKPQGGPEA